MSVYLTGIYCLTTASQKRYDTRKIATEARDKAKPILVLLAGSLMRK